MRCDTYFINDMVVVEIFLIPRQKKKFSHLFYDIVHFPSKCMLFVIDLTSLLPAVCLEESLLCSLISRSAIVT